MSALPAITDHKGYVDNCESPSATPSTIESALCPRRLAASAVDGGKRVKSSVFVFRGFSTEIKVKESSRGRN